LKGSPTVATALLPDCQKHIDWWHCLFYVMLL